MNILLWRHAEAFDARAGEDDMQRRLTPKGQEQSAVVARWLNTVLPVDARILASPAVRTQQTAEALGREVSTRPALVSGASVHAVLETAGWLSGTPASDTVVIVGHQPTLGMVCASLMAGAHQHWHVDKAAVWWLRRDRWQEGRAELVAMRTPEHA